MAKVSKDLKSDPGTSTGNVEKVINELVATANSGDSSVQVKDVTSSRNKAKRNLFGTLPMELDESATSRSHSLIPELHFSFHSPIKDGVAIPDTESLHDSVSSVLHQLPPMGDGDAVTVDNQYTSGYELACTDDDQWLENVSISAWEGQLGEASPEVGGADGVSRVLRRFMVQSVSRREQMDDSDAVKNNTRYCLSHSSWNFSAKLSPGVLVK